MLDKITILQIKLERIASREARLNVARELQFLGGAAEGALAQAAGAGLIQRLKAVNEDLWDI